MVRSWKSTDRSENDLTGRDNWISGVWLNPYPVVHCSAEPLFAAKIFFSSLHAPSQRSERANPGVAATRKSKYWCRGRPESLLRGPTFTARFPRRRYLRINLFHGELIQSLLLRAFPRGLKPLRDRR